MREQERVFSGVLEDEVARNMDDGPLFLILLDQSLQLSLKVLREKTSRCWGLHRREE